MNELMMTTGLANYSNNSVSAGPLRGRGLFTVLLIKVTNGSCLGNDGG